MADDSGRIRSSARKSESSSLAIPDVTADLRQRIGSSPIDEFVFAHGAVDVFRELVQNEFDADGLEISIRFTEDGLDITGTGRAVPPKGWSRLSVLIGTGEVLGDQSGEIIAPKESSIGSKNLGMRSLFRFGDRIHVRSNGQMAILDLREFVVGRQKDPATKGRKGILIQVPYRTTSLRKFAPFSETREAADLDAIERSLFPTLVKLALTGRRKGVRKLSIASDRHGRRMQWQQNAETERTRVPGISLVRRHGQLRTRDGLGAKLRRDHEELEYSRLADIPIEYVGLNFPDYFQSAGQVRIAVSLSLKAGRPIGTATGYFYYPLQAHQARTGCAVCVSAPFLLDAERTRLNDHAWNDWLKGQAADLVADLIGSDWFGRFGRAAYDVVLKQGNDERTFADLVAERLKVRPCWPNAEGKQGLASALVVPAFPALRGHLAAEHYLHPDLAAEPDIAGLAKASGAKPFTVNSLVRLRCGSEKTGGIATKVEGQANFCYSGYPGRALDPEEQHRTAAALTELKAELTRENAKDLRETKTTLSAALRLEIAEDLVRVSPEMWKGCPEPEALRLHPALYEDMAVARHCRRFDLARWIEAAAERAEADTSTQEERDALYHHLQLPETKLSSRLVGVVRRSPVIKDDKGDWARPDALALLATRDGRLLGLVVRAPASELQKRPDLLERLAIRRKIVSADLIAMAAALSDAAHLAEPFEELLRRQQALLTPKTVRALADLPFLRNRAGQLVPPGRAHVPTPINLTLLADTDLLPEDRPLYRRLDCQLQPSAAMLLEVIERARADRTPPPVPNHLYPALVETLRTNRQLALQMIDTPILYVGGNWATPLATIVAARPPRSLQEAIPIVKAGGPLADAYISLGASITPRPQHWLAFFALMDRRAVAHRGIVMTSDRLLLREAYRYLGLIGLPAELPTSALSLLSSDGMLNSIDDLNAGRFVENDYPDLADALVSAKAGIAFADKEEASRIIFRRLRIQPLSERCGEPRVQIGAPATAPLWFNKVGKLEQLHRADLAHGLAELASAHQKQNRDFQPERHATIRRRLHAIQAITFTADLQRTYQLGKRVNVPADAVIQDGVLYLRPLRYRTDYDHILSLELARLAGAARLADIRTLASSTLPLVQSSRPGEILAYLRRLGIDPKAWGYGKDGADNGTDDADAIRDEIAQSLMASVHIAQASPTTPPPWQKPISPPVSPPAAPPAPPAPPPPLPALDQVTLSVTLPTGSAPPPSTGGGGGGGWRISSGFTPRSAEQIERDREIGRRGEALVYRQELERVRALGFEPPEDHVAWVSQNDPGADHDIRSVDAKGGAIWIEVKSTTGFDGNFEWSIAEFERALSEGPRYVLWRVYNVAGPAPTAKRFENPANLLKTTVMRLEISSLKVFVEGR